MQGAVDRLLGVEDCPLPKFDTEIASDICEVLKMADRVQNTIKQNSAPDHEERDSVCVHGIYDIINKRGFS